MIKKPRQTRKPEYRTNSKIAYTRFCNRHPDIKIDFKLWRDIVVSYNLAIRDHILDTGEIVKIPSGFGPLSISKKKPKPFKDFLDANGKPRINLPIDWKASKAAGKWIYHMNSHTDGYRYKWFWNPYDSMLFNGDVHSFKPSRKASRLLTKYLQDSKYAQLYMERERNYNQKKEHIIEAKILSRERKT